MRAAQAARLHPPPGRGAAAPATRWTSWPACSSACCRPQLPEIPGWEIAARSLLATEAGGDLYDVLRDEEGNLWIAAGDVAGHGYSCAIAQAMTMAALTSLIGAEQTPSERAAAASTG